MGRLHFNNINKIYPNGFQAVKDFNLNVEDGEFIVLVGPSGCGKSTLLRMIAGLESITTGELILDDKVVNKLAPVDRDIAIVFQDYALYSNLTVYDNVGMSLNLRHEPDEKIYDVVMKASDFLGLNSLLKRMPAQLSGGQKQRVALGRTVVRNPKVFLMDEPLSNLDAKLRATTRSEIVKLQKDLKTTTIYVTHDQTEAMTMADRMVVMKDGIVQQIGTPKEIYNSPANMFVGGFIGSPPMNFIEGVIENGCFVSNGHHLKISEGKMSKLKAYDQKAVVLGIRPEFFRYEEEGSENTLLLDVYNTEFLGNHYILYVNYGTELLSCRLDELKLQDKDKVALYVDLEKAFFFDKETTRRII